MKPWGKGWMGLLLFALSGCEERQAAEGRDGSREGGDAPAPAARPSPEPAGGSGGDETSSWPAPRGGVTLQGRVHALVPRNPEIAWTFTADAGIFAPAAIAEGMVFVGSVTGMFYALDAATGEERWRFETEDTIESPPTVAAGSVFVGSNDGTLYALDTATGKEKWRVKGADKFSAGANVTKSPDGTEDWLVVNGYDGLARCLRVADGSVVWKFQTDEYINGAPAVLDGKHVVFGGCDAVIYTLKLEDGTMVNEVVTDSYITGTVATYGSKVYLGNDACQVVAADAFKPDLEWVYDDSKFPFFSAPAVTEGAVFIGCRDKQLHAIDRLTGKGLWKFKTGGRVDSSPLAFDDAVVFGSTDGRLYALNPAGGGELWVLDLGEGLSAAPAFASGLIVIGGGGETVFAIKESQPKQP